MRRHLSLAGQAVANRQALFRRIHRDHNRAQAQSFQRTDERVLELRFGVGHFCFNCLSSS